jgi:hypothetical protein
MGFKGSPSCTQAAHDTLRANRAQGCTATRTKWPSGPHLLLPQKAAKAASWASRPVAAVKATAVSTASMHGFHPGFSCWYLPPGKKLILAHIPGHFWSILFLSSAQRMQVKRKCFVDSGAALHAQTADSAAPILNRYLLSLLAPVRSCASSFACLLGRL